LLKALFKKIFTKKEYREGYSLIDQYILKRYIWLKNTPILNAKYYNNITDYIDSGFSENKAVRSALRDANKYNRLQMASLNREGDSLKRAFRAGKLSIDDIKEMIATVNADITGPLPNREEKRKISRSARKNKAVKEDMSL